MRKLIDGIHQFRSEVFGSHQALFERLESGQQPMALFITCSDSRIVPNLITQADPGELFIIRNAGNIVPPYGSPAGGEAGTIEYAVSALKVKDVIICGHSHCGAMGGILQPEALGDLDSVRDWLRFADSTKRILRENYSHIEDPSSLLATAVEENVLVQLENLKTHPSVAAAIARDELKLHGWTYKFESGTVSAYDPSENKFAPI